MAANQPNSLLLPQKKVSLPPPPYSERSFLTPPSQSPVLTILAYPLPLFLSQFNQLTQIIIHFLVIFFQVTEVSWLMMASEGHCGQQRVEWQDQISRNIHGTQIWEEVDLHFLWQWSVRSTTSYRNEPWIVCCQWNVCDCTKMLKSAKRVL